MQLAARALLLQASLSLCACAPSAALPPGGIALKSALGEVLATAADAEQRGLSGRDLSLFRAGAELRLAAGNVERALSSSAERDIRALSEDDRALLASIEAHAREVRALRPGPSTLRDAALVDLRQSADLLIGRRSFALREVRGVAMLEPEGDARLQVAGTGLGPDTEGQTQVEVAASGRKLEPSRLTRAEPNVLTITLPRELLSAPERPALVPVVLTARQRWLTGEWPFRSWQEVTSEITVQVIVVPRAARQLFHLDEAP